MTYKDITIKLPIALYDDIKNVLKENETIYSFIIEAIKLEVEYRKAQKGFKKETLATTDKTSEASIYISFKDSV